MGLIIAIVFLLVFFAVAMSPKGNIQMGAKKRQMKKIAQKIADNFDRVGWSSWGYSTHLLNDQIQRMHRADISSRMELLHYSGTSHTARVRGETGNEYVIDENGCSCPDFRVRGLPCKHMYFAVAELIGDEE